uniref:RRM domain-containing protein n=1 Tax=Timema poppense TaxID=170557 RepID=A0A7R9H7G6_TIMPO|nr:unnamed protein product [Timema poppensis]
MAENQEYDMGNGEFAQDDQQYDQQDDQMNGEAGNENGGGDAPTDSGSAEAPGKDDDRKLFVGGLSWETTDKELREHFIQYGEIESINVKTDPNTGRSRGFAFIVFTGAETIEKVLSAGDHIINNKKVDPKKAKARHGKIFVGGLVPELTDDDIKNFFAQYGTIVEVEMPFDKLKNMRKGFCFITFESEQVVMELLRSPKQSINGKEPLQSPMVWAVLEVEEVLPEEVEVPGEEEEGHEEAEGVRLTVVTATIFFYLGYASQGWGNQGGYGGYGGYDQGYGGYGYGDYYGSGYGNYGGYGSGYDYSGYPGYSNYDYGGYGNSYDAGYSGGRGGGRGKGTGSTGGGYSGKQRGGRSQTQRHQPY